VRWKEIYEQCNHASNVKRVNDLLSLAYLRTNDVQIIKYIDKENIYEIRRERKLSLRLRDMISSKDEK
jgi:hypothetical protein